MIPTYQTLEARRRARNIDGEKLCGQCREWQPEDRFSINRKMVDGLSSACKTCDRFERLRYLYGVSKATYTALLDAQYGVCAICLSPPDEGEHLAVDHDHSCCPSDKACSNCIRGLLCRRCNMGLGYFRDDADSMQRAIRYVESRSAQPVAA